MSNSTPIQSTSIQDMFCCEVPAGVYAKRRAPLPPSDVARPALFLDRDGVINEDIGYLHGIEDLVIREGIAERIAAARMAGWETVIVTNQSGVGRGYYDWDAFERLHHEIDHRLAHLHPKAVIGMICACPFHPEAQPPYAVQNHPWRKPNPGMLQFAAQVLDLDLAKSTMMGDSKSDEQAAWHCGVKFEYT